MVFVYVFSVLQCVLQHIGHRIHTKACLAKNTQQALFSHTVGKHNINTETRIQTKHAVSQYKAGRGCWCVLTDLYCTSLYLWFLSVSH